MTNRIEGYIGCPECKTVLFRLEAEPGANPGVWMHVKVKIGEVADGAMHCPVVECGAALARVPAPK